MQTNTVDGVGLGVANPQNAAGRYPANIILDKEAAAALDEQSGTSKSKAHTGRPSAGVGTNAYGDYGGQENVTMGHSDSGGASRFFYQAKASKADRSYGMPEGSRNDHTTVKPIQLMRYLCRLITPPEGLILDPFMGSGSTGIAAILEGFRFVGIEQDPHYLTDICAPRLRAALIERYAPDQA